MARNVYLAILFAAGCALAQEELQISASSQADGDGSFSATLHVAAHHHAARGGAGAHPPVHVVTSVHGGQCNNPLGNWLQTLALKNMQDYAQLKGYAFSWYMGAVNASTPGVWTKISAIQSALRRMPEDPQQWVMWVDSDALFWNITAEPKWADFEGKDLIIFAGSPDCAIRPDALMFNSGAFLLRNTAWSRQYVEEMLVFSQPEWREGGGAKILTDNVINGHVYGLPTQTAMAYMWQTRPDVVERTLCPSNNDGGDNARVHDLWTVEMWERLRQGEMRPPLIFHWAGCSLCSDLLPLARENCTRSYVDTFADASVHLSQQLGSEEPFSAWNVRLDALLAGARD